jgi:hypothetical protein
MKKKPLLKKNIFKNCPKRYSKSYKCRARQRTERKTILESELIVVKTQNLSKKFQKTSPENKCQGRGEDTNDLVASLEKFSSNKSFQRSKRKCHVTGSHQVNSEKRRKHEKQILI